MWFYASAYHVYDIPLEQFRSTHTSSTPITTIHVYGSATSKAFCHPTRVSKALQGLPLTFREASEGGKIGRFLLLLRLCPRTSRYAFDKLCYAGVFSDVRALLKNDALINTIALDVFREYNEQQMVTIAIPDSSEEVRC